MSTLKGISPYDHIPMFTAAELAARDGSTKDLWPEGYTPPPDAQETAMSAKKPTPSMFEGYTNLQVVDDPGNIPNRDFLVRHVVLDIREVDEVVLVSERTGAVQHGGFPVGTAPLNELVDGRWVPPTFKAHIMRRPRYLVGVGAEDAIDAAVARASASDHALGKAAAERDLLRTQLAAAEGKLNEALKKVEWGNEELRRTHKLYSENREGMVRMEADLGKLREHFGAKAVQEALGTTP